MTRHDLKCWRVPFDEIRRKKKKFEFRFNDRDYKVGDELVLHEWDHIDKFFTGNVLYENYVISILTEGFGLPEGYCIMSLGEKSELDG
jgi:hypothetical protein